MQECNVDEASDEEEASSKGSKDKKSNGPDSGKGLVFKITSKVAYKTVLKGLFSINCSSYLVQFRYLSFHPERKGQDGKVKSETSYRPTIG